MVGFQCRPTVQPANVLCTVDIRHAHTHTVVPLVNTAGYMVNFLSH